MPGILVDIKDLHKYNMNRLLQKTRKVDYDRISYFGIIVIVSPYYFEYINKLPKGPMRVDYMNSEEFVNNINGVYYIIYNANNKICEIRENINNKTHLKDVIKSTVTYLPEDATIWVGIITPENSGVYIDEGFNDPYKCDRSPLGFKFNKTGIAFIRKNKISTNDSSSHYQLNNSSIKNKLKYLDIADKIHPLKCTICVRFTRETLEYLKKINQPTDSDRELSGSLVVSKVISTDSGKNIVFELSSNPDSVISGHEEEVDAVWSRYNFHTHPKKAYENHGVKNGWPSSQDFVGFLDLKNNTIFHTVVTLEGVYIISLSVECDVNINKINRKYILKHYHINHLDNITPKEYIKQINNKKYKGKQLFDVRYMDWGNANEIFHVFFEKTNGSCLVTDNNFDISQRNY
jgi:hypothetical protein